MNQYNYKILIILVTGLFFQVGDVLSEPAPPSENGDTLQTLLQEEIEWLHAESYIYSASRQEERLFTTPAAAYVVTQEEIRRSGARSIPELLRRVPGVQVSRIDASKWEVTIRGFNNRFASKLLILVDGRNIYSPLFGGVFWEMQDLLLDDIERIEVIRGPGATLWGANSENGVINIITKHSAKTQGTYIEGGAGNQETGFAGLRYGGKVNDQLSFRIYGKNFSHDDFAPIIPQGSEDDWRSWSGGFRMDWQGTPKDDLMFEGNLYDALAGSTRREVDPVTPIPPPPDFLRFIEADQALRGGNLLARWNHRFSASRDLRLQMIYDQYDNDLVRDLKEQRKTFDIDGQYHLMIGSAHNIVTGGGYRLSADDTEGSTTISLDDEDLTLNLYNLFVQDRITLITDLVYLTLGSKFEHNDYTGLEIQPNARLLWTPRENQTVWLSMARAVRFPTRTESSLHAINGRNVVPQGPNAGNVITRHAFGNDDLEGEKLIAYELGYRIQPTKVLLVDIALFYNDYTDLINTEPASPRDFGLPPASNQALTLTNNQEADVYGFEINAEWTITDFWRVTANYSNIQIDVDFGSNPAAAANATRLEDSSPTHLANLWSMFDLPWNLEFDLGLNYVDEIFGSTGPNALGPPTIPDYLRLDLRLGWAPTQNVEVSFVVQNALDSRHLESSPSNAAVSTEIERSIYGMVTLRF